MSQPSLSSELKAMAREAMKDIRSVLVDQGYFGQHGGHGEPGTPLNPTQAEMTNERGVVNGFDSRLDEAASRAPEQEQPDRGMSR